MSRFTVYLSPEKQAELARTAKLLVTPGKGILAADESVVHVGIKLKDINVENNEENRRRLRDLLFTTCNEIGDYISGAILFDETARQTDSKGVPFIECLENKGIIPGIKVDKGVVHMAGTPRENTTVGLDGLKERCDEYRKMGFRFAKWRSVLKVTNNTPSHLAVMENTHNLARCASICQQCGLVPLLVAEVLSEGDHDLLTTKEITEDVLATLFKCLADHHVFLEGVILKPNMIVPGESYEAQEYSPAEIALATVQAMHRRVPPAVAGIAFCSGAQGEDLATAHLNEMNKANGLASLGLYKEVSAPSRRSTIARDEPLLPDTSSTSHTSHMSHTSR